MCWPDMTAALTRLASPVPVSAWVGRAIGVFPYVFTRENSECCAAWVSEVQMLSNFAQGDYLPKGKNSSPGLKERRNFYFQQHHLGYLNEFIVHILISACGQGYAFLFMTSTHNKMRTNPHHTTHPSRCGHKAIDVRSIWHFGALLYNCISLNQCSN